MKKSILLITFLFIVLILPSIYADDDVLPNQVQVDNFIQILIDRYQTLVNKRDYQILEKDEFDFKKRFFSLYLYDEIGSAFNIVCVKCNISRNDGVFFAVEPSQYLTSTIVALDYNHTLVYYHPGFSLSGKNTIAKGNEWTEVYKGIEIVRYYTLAFGVPTRTVIESDFNDIAYLAERIYNIDNQHYEYFRINRTWYFFLNKYSDFISNYSQLGDIKDEIDDKIKYIFSGNGYDYETFLNDFIPFNITVQHYIDLPKMINEWSDFKNYTSSIDFCIGCYPEINISYCNIENDIHNNESYLYVDFYQRKIQLNESIQIIREKQVKFLFNIFYSFIFTIIISIVIIITEKQKYLEKIPKKFNGIIGEYSKKLASVPIYVFHLGILMAASQFGYLNIEFFNSYINSNFKFLPLLPIVIQTIYHLVIVIRKKAKQ